MAGRQVHGARMGLVRWKEGSERAHLHAVRAETKRGGDGTLDGSECARGTHSVNEEKENKELGWCGNEDGGGQPRWQDGRWGSALEGGRGWMSWSKGTSASIQGVSMRMMWGGMLFVHEPGALHDGEMRRQVSSKNTRAKRKKEKK